MPLRFADPTTSTPCLLSRPHSAIKRIFHGPATSEADLWVHALALLWQIYSCRCSLQIHFRQCGHRCGGSRAKSSRMAWRTAGKGGWGGGPSVLFFPSFCWAAGVVVGSVSGPGAVPLTVQALPGSSLEVVKTEFFFHLLVSLLANPSRLDGGC